MLNHESIKLRNPNAIRPWQHVLEPICGYLILAEKLYKDGVEYNGGWNFGPNDEDFITVVEIVHLLYNTLGEQEKLEITNRDQLHEANL
jgi:CDP-glucose 4,6-dehydratase